MPIVRSLIAVPLLTAAVVAQTPTFLGDLVPGPLGARPLNYAALAGGGTLTMFNADDGVGGIEPWVTDGTAAGTQPLADLWPGAIGSTPRDHAAIGDRMVFAAYLPGLGEELAVTDGTPAGTGPLVDLRPGLANSNPYGLTRFRGQVLFVANDGSGLRSWRTDGTAAGTWPLAGVPTHFLGGVEVGGKLYWFRAAGSAHELWCWDGVAPASTFWSCPQLASQTPPGVAVAFGDRLAFYGPAQGSTRTLHLTDGTAAGTTAALTVIGQPWGTAAAGGLLYVIDGSSGYGRTLRVCDGTPGVATTLLQSASIAGLVPVGDRMFFMAGIGAPFDLLRCTDGTAAGTVVLGPVLGQLCAIGERRLAYFAADLNHGVELWISDGTAAGTQRATDLNPGPASSFDGLRALLYHAGRLTFWADDGVHGHELWSMHVGASARRVGGGCAAGAIPTLRAQDPVLGATTDFAGERAAPSSAGFLLIGLPATLPALLGSCELHVDPVVMPIAVPFATDAAGGYVVPALPVPAAGAFDGVRFAAQAVIVAPSGPLLGLDVSDAVLLTLGD